MNCFNCKSEIQVVSGKIGRRDTCSKCNADLHCCRNCQHYDPKVYNECREPIAEVVKEKDRSNFCDQFVLGSRGEGPGQGQDSLLSAAEALFKKK